MKTRRKKMLSLLLSVAMIFSMSTISFAEEVEAEGGADTGFFETESVELDAADEAAEFEVLSGDGLSDNTVTPNVIPELIKDISANILSMSENLTATDCNILSGNDNTYLIVHDRAVGYDCRKFCWILDEKKVDSDKYNTVKIDVYKVPKSHVISADEIEQLTSENSITPDGFQWLSIKKVAIKGKGATVDITGAGIVPLNKSCYISSIKLDTDYKTENKELGALIKAEVKKIKKGKDVKVSANGFKNGSDKQEDHYNLTIGVYPAYIGNMYNGYNYFNNWYEVKKSIFGTDSGIGVEKIYDAWPLTKKSNGVYKQTVKAKDGKITSINTGYEIYNDSETAKVIKAKLKVTKKPEKPLGLVNSGEKYTFVDPKSGQSTEMYKVETNGNFFGTFLYPANPEKDDTSSGDD